MVRMQSLTEPNIHPSVRSVCIKITPLVY